MKVVVVLLPKPKSKVAEYLAGIVNVTVGLLRTADKVTLLTLSDKPPNVKLVPNVKLELAVKLLPVVNDI